MDEQGSDLTVFVVHGRNADLRRSMFDFLRSVGLQPLEWSQAVALTGAGSPYIGQVLDAAFDHARAVVVLLTPDEIAYLQTDLASGPDDPEAQPAPQARPNVLFEAGMALGRDEKRTVLVEVGTVRPFSDVAGRHAVRLDNSTGARQALADRLRTAGCSVDTTGTDWHDAGDFSAPTPPGGGAALGRRVPSSTSTRPRLAFDAKYIDLGGNRIDKLQVINRGTETAFEVTLDLPPNAALTPHRDGPIAKIPPGKSVTIDVMNHGRMYGGSTKDEVFDLTVTGRTVDGETVSTEVFMDVNG